MTKTDRLKTLIRPVVTIMFVATILGMGIWLMINRPSSDMAREFAVFILSSGSLIIGMWFGSRTPPTNGVK